MCMSIGFILSGCNQSLTDLSKYPPIDNSDEKYLYNRFNQKIIVYNTNLLNKQTSTYLVIVLIMTLKY